MTGPGDTDPALVAAHSRVAQTLFAATGTGGVGEPSPGAVPPESRYAGVGTTTTVDPDTGAELVHLRRRFVPPAERLATAGWERVADGDRVDLLAARTLGDPTAFWQLCDANGAFDPAELEQPGRVVRVALPEGFPGGGDA
ncbi:hypothetical protein AB0I85_25865 [Micromonospora echinofusca]|uniref:hypothetical protein n=1 Tax=Micromonospora echinofusca TaxID=47858 RepID=UPI000CBFEDA1|nr:hypothetical protein [Micromonospora sp. MSM11]MCL7456199.1 hypothetical protein [Micromonospora sp. MSM11]